MTDSKESEQKEVSTSNLTTNDKNLHILGAAYGLADVTAKVRSLVTNNQLTVTANNTTFGDSWQGVEKSLVIVYKYGANSKEAAVAYAKEGSQLTISMTSTWKRHQFTLQNNKLTILGAVYGLGDVTTAATSKISDNSFVQVANNETWEDTWKGIKKSFVVVYTYDETPLIKIVEENATMKITHSPVLIVHGATWGPLAVKDIVNKYNTGHALEIKASNEVIGTDSLVGHKKTLVIVYQYYGYVPNYKLAIEGDVLHISFDATKETPVSNKFLKPDTLYIAKAIYGLGDVTSTANKLINENQLSVTANNTTFTDTWVGYEKVLTIVYTYGTGSYQTKSAVENTQLIIKQNDPKIESNALFSSIQKEVSVFNLNVSDQSLYILGAAYGLADVTAKVRSLIANNQLTVTANNTTFGDSWKGVEKSLVIVYKYGVNSKEAGVAYVKEGSQLTILPTSTWTKHQFTLEIGKLTILGAAYGLGDVTTAATSKISDNSFIQSANNTTWGDTWKGVQKSLVVVYAYDGVPWVNIVEENVTMRIIDSPPLTVLGATWGPLTVSNIVGQYNTNRALRIVASNEVIGTDSLVNHKKTLVIVYQYYGYLPNYKLAIEGDILYISFDKTKETPGTIKSLNPDTLNIAKAIYGLGDVTSTANKLINENQLNVTANNATFTDTWVGYEKVLTIVYSHGSGLYQTSSVVENSRLTIFFPKAKTNIFYDASNFLENNDKFKLTMSGLYVTVGSDKYLTLTNNVDNASIIQIKINGSSTLFQIDNSYVALDNTTKKLYVDNDISKASSFETQFDQFGYVHFITGGNAVSCVQDSINSGSFSLQSKSTLQEAFPGGLSSFDVKIVSVSPTLYHALTSSNANVKFTDCELKWASFIWQLTGGFVAALGLIPFMTNGQIQTGVLAIIQSNARAWSYVQRLQQIAAANNTLPVWGTSAFTVSGFLTLLYAEGLLWKVFKLILNFAGWWLASYIISKLLIYIFAPEVEAATLVASFIVWSAQLVLSGLAVGTCKADDVVLSLNKKLQLLVV